MDLASLRAQQIELASSVIREDRLDKDPPDLIGGADVGFEQGGEVTRAAMVLLKYPSLELVDTRWRASRPPCRTFRAFSPSAKPPRCWQRGRCSRKSRICCLSMVTGFRTRAVWASPAILGCWWMCADHWRGEKTAVRRLNRSSANPARWRR